MKLITSRILTGILLVSLCATDAFGDLDGFNAPRVAWDGLFAIALGIAAAGLFIGIGIALGKRKSDR